MERAHGGRHDAAIDVVDRGDGFGHVPRVLPARDPCALARLGPSKLKAEAVASKSLRFIM